MGMAPSGCGCSASRPCFRGGIAPRHALQIRRTRPRPLTVYRNRFRHSRPSHFDVGVPSRPKAGGVDSTEATRLLRRGLLLRPGMKKPV